MRSITDPLFSKEFCHSNKSTFKEKYASENKEWFDKECVKARGNYLKAMGTFKTNHSDELRKNFCEKKKKL